MSTVRQCRLCHTSLAHQRQFCNRECFRKWFIGANNSQWNGGISFRNGYRTILINGRYIREHRLVIERHLGRSLQPHQVAHHINGNKLDNRIENLQLMKKHDHHRYHFLHTLAKRKRLYQQVTKIPPKVTIGKTIFVLCGYAKPQYFIGFICPDCKRAYWVSKDYTKRQRCRGCAFQRSVVIMRRKAKMRWLSSWAKHHVSCVICHQTAWKHAYRGRCSRCAQREWKVKKREPTFMTTH